MADPRARGGLAAGVVVVVLLVVVGSMVPTGSATAARGREEKDRSTQPPPLCRDTRIRARRPPLPGEPGAVLAELLSSPGAADQILEPGKAATVRISRTNNRQFLGLHTVISNGAISDISTDISWITVPCEEPQSFLHLSQNPVASIDLDVQAPDKQGVVTITFYTMWAQKDWYGPSAISFMVGNNTNTGQMKSPEDLTHPKDVFEGRSWSRQLKQSSDCGQSDLGYACMKEFAGYFRLHWTVGGMENGRRLRRRLLQSDLPDPDPAEGEIALAMEGDNDGWVGIGFPEQQGVMIPADFVLGFVTSSGFDVKPYRVLEAQNIVEEDFDDTVTLTDVTAIEQDGKTIIAFTRNTMDGMFPISFTQRMAVNYAVSDFDGIGAEAWHGLEKRNGSSILFAEGTASERDGAGSGTEVDAGFIADTGSSADAGSIADAGSTDEAGSSADVGSTADAGSSVDGNADAGADADAGTGASADAGDEDGEEPQPEPKMSSCLESTLPGYDCMVQPPGLKVVRIHWVLGTLETLDQEQEISTENETGSGRRRLSQDGQIPSPGPRQISIALEGDTDGWVGFGFAENPGLMNPSDVVLGWVEDGVANIKPYRVEVKNIAESDVDEDVELFDVQGREENGITIIEFTRNIDSITVPLATLEGNVSVNAAVGTVDALMIHEQSDRLGFSINFLTGETEDESLSSLKDYYKIHGTLMILAWMGFIPTGIHIAGLKWAFKSLKKSRHGLWFQMHRAIQTIAVGAILAAFIIAFEKFRDHDELDKPRRHQKLGYTMCALISAQFMVAFVRPHNDSDYRFLFNFFHWGVGYSSYILSFATIIFGIQAYEVLEGENIKKWTIPVIAAFATHLVLFCILQFMRLLSSIRADEDL